MKSVWKFDIAWSDGATSVSMPFGAKILSAQIQQDILRVWALCNVDEVMHGPRNFRIFGTGHSIPDNLKLRFLSTVQLCGGGLVFHVFEDGEKSGPYVSSEMR